MKNNELMVFCSERKAKILTDVDIYQSPSWRQQTDLTEDLYPRWLRSVNNLISGPSARFKHIFDSVLMIRYLFRYDVIITGNIKTAQLIGIVRAIWRLKTPKHIVLELMLDEHGRSIRWKLKRAIQAFLFSAIDLIFVSSTSEITTYSERFRLPAERFRFLPFHTDIIKPERITAHKGYILSAGKTGRDYDTLLKAVEGMDVKVVIVSDEHHVRGLQLPPNVLLLVDIPYENYLKLLRESYFVVVPLRRLVKSTGQVVILEAMGIGKPVIATGTIGTADYIQHGVNGLLVPIGDSVALRSSIHNLMSEKNLYDRLAINGLETVDRYHTFDAYVAAILHAAHGLQARVK